MAKNPGLLKSSSWIAWVSLLRNQYPEMISGRGKFLSGGLMPCPCQCGRSRPFSARAIAAAPTLITMPTIAQNAKRKLIIFPRWPRSNRAPISCTPPLARGGGKLHGADSPTGPLPTLARKRDREGGGKQVSRYLDGLGRLDARTFVI